MSPWIILDRDGVINEDSDAYIKSPDEWTPIPNSLEAIALLNKKGYGILVATNQSGLARKYYTLDTLEIIHQKMHAAIEKVGGKITGLAFCPHGPDDNCLCRKPKPGLLVRLAEDHNVELSDTYFVGDTWSDIECAKAAGAKPALVLTGKGALTQSNHSDKLANCEIYSNLMAFAENQPVYQNKGNIA